MAAALSSLRHSIARGVGKSFVFPGAGGQGGPWGSYGGWFGGSWGLLPGTDYDYARRAGPPWLNGIAMTALGWICGAWPEAKLVIHRPKKNDKPEVIRESRALDLIANPNTDYDDTVLLGGMLLSMLTGDGNAYFWKDKQRLGNVEGLYYVPHFMMTPQWPGDGTDFIGGYVYQVNGRRIVYPENQIVHLRNPKWPIDPYNLRKAMHPLAGELRSIANDNEERNFSASLLRNMAIPGAFISPKDAMQTFLPEQAEALKKLFTERFSGDNRGAPLASDIPAEVTLLGFSPEQLATDKLALLNISRICAAIGVDPLVLGLPSHSKTYDNLREARKGAYDNLLIPLQRSIDSQLTKQIIATNELLNVPKTDTYGHDYSEVSALQEQIDEKYKRISEAVKAGWLSPNDGRREVGLEEIDGGDELRPAGGMGGGFGSEGQPPVPRAASLSPSQAAKQAAIARKWQVRAEERRQLASSNGHG